MDEADLYRLDSIRPFILENLDAKHVMDYLIETEVLEPSHDEEIRAESSAKSRTEKLLEILPGSRHPDALTHLKKALEKDYGFIMKKLDDVRVPDHIRTGQGGLQTIGAATAADVCPGITTTTSRTVTTTNIRGNKNIVIMGGENNIINFH